MLLKKDFCQYRTLMVFLVFCAVATLGTALQARLLWWDGSITQESSAPGKLLSDNEDYWGDVVLTGVTYLYEGATPDAPADNRVDRNGRTGRVLIDGNPDKPIGLNAAQPLVAVFDFNRLCTFTEWDICLPKPDALAITLEFGMPGEDDQAITWQTVFVRSLDDSAVSRFFRIALEAQPSGRYVRVTVQGRGVTALTEMLALGRCAIRRYGQRSVQPRHRADLSRGRGLPDHYRY